MARGFLAAIAQAEGLARMLATATAHDDGVALDTVHVHHTARAIADKLAAALDR